MFFRQKNLLVKMQHFKLNPHFFKKMKRGKIKMLNIHNLLCQKFSAVYRKIIAIPGPRVRFG